jgi:uncharacterized phage protein gp47/JayE
MPLTPPTLDELFNKWRQRMEPLGFNNWGEGSRIGAIGLVINSYIRDVWLSLADLEDQSNPSTARGIYLDRLGEMFGVKRLPPQSASTLGRGPSLKFTNNGATSITVPAGTRIWNTDEPDIAFFTQSALVLTAGAEGFVDVVAGAAGETYNVGANTLTSHNVGTSQVTVTNIRPIGGGQFFESDQAYRFRISQALQARHGATALSVRQELLKIPGVRDVLIHEGVRGNGSLDVIVIPIDRFASQSLLDAAEVAVSDTVAAGISWRVLTPKTVRVDVTVQLRLDGAAIFEEARVLVESAIRGYLDNLRVNDGNGGAEMIYNELISRIQDAASGILDSAVNIAIDGVPSLQTNVIPKPGERLVSSSVSIT